MTASITVDGQNLDQLVAQGVEGITGLMTVPAKRNGNLVIPGAHGQLHAVGKRFDAANLVSPMWVRGVNPDGTIPSGTDDATRLAFHARVRALVAMFAPERVTLRHTLTDGTAREITGEVTDVLDFTVRGSGRHTLGQVAVGLNCADPFWTDLADTTDSITVTTGGTGTLEQFDGASAPMENLIVTFGQQSNPRLEQAATGVFVGYNGVIGAGQSLVVNTATWALSGTGGLTITAASYTNLYYGGPGTSRWFALNPAAGGPVVALTHTGGGSATVTVTGRRRYKTP